MARKPKPKSEDQAPAPTTQEVDPRQADVTEFIKPDPSIVKPTMQFDGRKNVLQAIFEGDPGKIPVLKSVGYTHVPGTNTYVAYVIHSRGGQILKIEPEEPNLRMITEDAAKILFVNELMMQEADDAQS